MDDLKVVEHTEILKLLDQGEKEIAAGVGYDLDGILAEADRLMDENGPCRFDFHD